MHIHSLQLAVQVLSNQQRVCKALGIDKEHVYSVQIDMFMFSISMPLMRQSCTLLQSGSATRNLRCVETKLLDYYHANQAPGH